MTRRGRGMARVFKRRSTGAAEGGLLGRRSWWIGAGLALAMVVAVWERSEVVSLGYEVSQLRAARDMERQRHRSLILESASLASLDRIERLASTQLGMAAAQSGQIQLVPEQPGVDPAAMVAALHLRPQVARAGDAP
ncbi:MAG: cell division protein FtsL [Nitrospirae bacterium]|nr:cell division protein FtsL [Nitrospirota bacterium]